MSATPPTELNHAQGPGLRVIAVGMGGRERALRGEGIELIRTKNALEALGELGLPIDESSPQRTVVLLESHAVAEGEIPNLSDALRRVDADVRVVAIDGHSEDLGEDARDALDAIVTPDVQVAHLEALFGRADEALGPPSLAEFAPMDHAPREPAGSAPEASKVSEDPSDTPLVDSPLHASTPVEARVPGPERPGDAAIRTPVSGVLRGVLSGRNLVMSYLSELASLPGAEHITYVDMREKIPRPAEDRARVVVDVALRGTRFGWLIGPRESETMLRAAADELALCTAVQLQQEQLRDSAFKDHLTRAWNRRYFDRHLERSLNDARSRRRDLTLLLFDIDDFKHYNDAYGHAAGDDILVETVRLLRAVTRPTDEVCRIGGDEFAVVFYEPDGPREPGSTPPRSIFSIAHRFRQQICAHRFPKLGEQAKGRLTISGGLATFPWDGHDAESLIDHADRLLMQSKREGKNVICLGPGAMRVCGPEDGDSGPPTPPQ